MYIKLVTDIKIISRCTVRKTLSCQCRMETTKPCSPQTLSTFRLLSPNSNFKKFTNLRNLLLFGVLASIVTVRNWVHFRKTVVWDVAPCWLMGLVEAAVTFKVSAYTGCPRRNVPDFGRVFLMLKFTDITQNTYVLSWTVTEIMAREVWNFDSCYTLFDYQIHIKIGRNMWFR